MLVSLKGLRFAFAHHYTKGKADAVTGIAKYGGSFLFELNSADPVVKANANAELAKLVAVISQVGKEKWADKSDAILMGLKANAKLCLRDGNSKAEYEGFAGTAFVAATNDVQPNIVAKELYSGKPVYVAQDGRGFIDGTLVEGQQFKAPYGGCYVNVQLDIWAQDNKDFGKRINAKFLGVQFFKDGLAFSGGAAFDEAGFEYENVAPGGANDPFAGGAGGFSFGAAAPAPAAGFAFGAAAPAPVAGFAFGAAAPAPAATGFTFGAAPAPATGGFSF